MKIGERIKEQRVKKNLSQAELAREVGVTQQTINALEAGKTDKTRHIVELANALNVSVDYLQGTQSLSGPAEASASRANIPRDVPVLGQVVGGDSDNADFEFNGQTIDYLRRPPGISMMRDVFGLYTTGTSMWPKFEDGEPIYVSAGRPPAIGDYVVIEMHPTDEGKNGAGYVKRLKRRTATKIVCEQFNPPKEVEFDRDHVKSVFRIIPLAELVGV